MNKSILVIDTPKCCSECKFLNDNYDYPECIITGVTKGYTFRTTKKKMAECPLKPIPQELYEGGTWTDNGYIEAGFANGWNNCIEEILG